jgi:hypothetical protein
MDHLLIRHGLRLTYLRGSDTIDELDQELILDDLFEGALPGEVPLWATRCFLSEYDHLVLAADTETNHFLGLVGARNGETDRETFLLLESGFVVAPARGQNLLRRMTALVLLRMAGQGGLPEAVATVTRNPMGCQVLRGVGAALRGARFSPEPDEAVISLNSVSMMQRIATSLGRKLQYGATSEALRLSRAAQIAQPPHASYGTPAQPDPSAANLTAEPMLVALDLRAAEESTLLTDARRLYRAKAPRTPAAKLSTPKLGTPCRPNRMADPPTTATS